MNLKEYFEKEGISIAKFARIHKMNVATLHNILKGEDIRLSTAIKLEKATYGKVTCQDLASQISKDE